LAASDAIELLLAEARAAVHCRRLEALLRR